MSEALPLKTAMHFTYGEPRELAPGVARIVANNPSPFTYKGTNTYLIGAASLALIDPGPADAAHLAAVLKAVGKRRLTHVFITHTHRDHLDGLPALVNATGAKTAGFGRRAAARGTRHSSPSGSEYVDQSFVPDHPVHDGDELGGEGWTLRAIHTPGHAPDHLCYALVGRNVLFSGDHVMGWNTSVVAPPEGNMGDYIRSLELLAQRSDGVYFPGHGGQVEDPQRLVKAFLLHRRMREQAVLECIRLGNNTVHSIMPIIYKGLDPKLHRAATLSVLAHVEYLIERGAVRCDPPLSADRALFAV